jgi:hypothetical protein
MEWLIVFGCGYLFFASLSFIYDIAVDIMEECVYKKELERLHISSSARIRKLTDELSLWKKACDNLDKELKDEAAKKGNVS